MEKDNPPDQAAAPAGNAKKGVFDSMDRAELISKCKSLIQLAKTAKQSKDDFANENVRLKDTLVKMQTQSTDDQLSLVALQKTLRRATDTVDALEEQKLLDKDYMKRLQQLVDDLTNDKTTLDGRVTQLAMDNEILAQLNESMQQHQQQVRQLQQMCEQQKAQSIELRQQHAADVMNAERLEAELAAMQEQLRQQHAADVANAERLEAKMAAMQERCTSDKGQLKMYRNKLASFAGQLKHMRVCNQVLRTTVTEYSQAVGVWQTDILRASNHFVLRNRELADDNQRLNVRLESATVECERMRAATTTTDEQQHQHQDVDTSALVVLSDDQRHELETLTALLQTLDQTLATVVAESERAETNHKHERTLLESRCVGLETELNALRDKYRSEADEQREQQEEPQNRAEPSREDRNQLIAERDSLIVKGQHLIEMVEELQTQLKHTDDELQLLLNERDALVTERVRADEVSQLHQRDLESKMAGMELDLARITSEKNGLVQQNEILNAELASLESSLLEKERLMSIEREAVAMHEYGLGCSLEETIEKKNRLKNERDSLAAERVCFEEAAKLHKQDLESQIAVIQSDLTMVSTAKESLAQQNEQLNAELANVKNELESVLEKNTGLETSLQGERVRSEEAAKLHEQHLESQIAVIQSDLAMVSTAKNNLAQQNEQLNAELAIVKNELESVLVKNTELESTLQGERVRSDEASNLHQQNAESRMAYIQSDLARISNEKDVLVRKIEELNSGITTLQIERDEQTAERIRIEATSQSLGQDLQSQFATMKSTLEAVSIEKATVVQQNETLNAQLATLNNELEAMHEKLNATKVDAAAAAVDLSKRLDDALQQIAVLQQSAERAAEERDQLSAIRSRETDDLLSEMRELNEAFRNRGDVISKQEQRIVSLVEELGERTTAADRLAVDRNGLFEQLSALQNAAAQMPAAANEQSSKMSTVSSVGEVANLLDLEDSFEEKYNKLRQLAFKLKAKCNMLTQRIAELEGAAVVPTKATEVGAPATTTAVVDTQLNRKFQLLLKEHDQLLDDIDSLKAERTELKIQIEKSDAQLRDSCAELSALKECQSQLELSAAADRRLCSDLDVMVKDSTKQLKSLTIRLSEAELERQTASDKLQALQSQLAAKCDEFEKLAADLKTAKQSSNKNNVLALECEAQEKSLTDLSQKLEAKSAQIQKLQLENNTLSTSNASLEQKIASLDSELQSEREASEDLKSRNSAQHSKLEGFEVQCNQLQMTIDDLRRELESTNEKMCEERLVLTQNYGQLEQSIEMLRIENQTQRSQLLGNDDTAVALRASLKSSTDELEALRTEFVAYKVRAQTMLRQNQQHETIRENELADELSAVRATVSVLNSKLAAAQQTTSQLNTTVTDLQAEVERLRTRDKQLMRIVDESRANVDAAHAEVRQLKDEHQDALRSLRQHSEWLTDCHKNETAELSAKHEQELRQLRHQQQQLQQHIQNQAHVQLPTGGIDSQMHNTSVKSHHPVEPNEWTLSERQAAEGSENNATGSRLTNVAFNASATKQNYRELVPLDVLLSAASEANAEGVIPPQFGSEYDHGEDSMATRELREQSQKQEIRVKHLTTLLAESEQDTARLTQQNAALKEELRRQERSAEREQHLHNLEYLKNVVFKFLTINQGDEKAHLVPVLNTMLKLSPEETQKLHKFAMGADPSQRGWGKYLPL